MTFNPPSKKRRWVDGIDEMRETVSEGKPYAMNLVTLSCHSFFDVRYRCRQDKIRKRGGEVHQAVQKGRISFCTCISPCMHPVFCYKDLALEDDIIDAINWISERTAQEVECHLIRT